MVKDPAGGVLARYTTGQYFGERALMGGDTRAADVVVSACNDLRVRVSWCGVPVDEGRHARSGRGGECVLASGVAVLLSIR